MREPAVAFDHHSPAFADDPYAVFDDLRDRCPVAHTEAHGGYWILTRYDDVARVALDDTLFCSGRGITIPPARINNIPINNDPPDVVMYRRVLHPLLSPKAIAEIEPDTRRLVTELVDDVIASRHCDVVQDIARPLTGITTLRLAGLDPSSWRQYADPFHRAVHGEVDDETRRREHAWVAASIDREIDEQRRRPRLGAISHLLDATVDGRPLSDHEIHGMILLFLIGGLDSTQAAIGNATVHLGRQPELRRRLVDDLSLLPSAVEEFLRFDAPTQSLARTATRDTQLDRMTVRAGDRVLLCWAAANRDPQEFDNPNEIVLDRHPNRHLSFGVGVHRCLGSNLARTEMRVCLEEILRRMPDYVLVEAGLRRAHDVGIVYGHVRVPITF